MKFVVLLAAITPPLFLLTYGVGKARASWRSKPYGMRFWSAP